MLAARKLQQFLSRRTVCCAFGVITIRCLLIVGMSAATAWSLPPSVVHVWEKKELKFTSTRSWNNPYVEVTIWVDLAGPGFQKRVFGFWDGERTFRVRILAPTAGEWKWQRGWNPPDPGLSGLHGEFRAIDWNEEEKRANPLRRGFVCWKDGRDMPDLHTVLFDYHGIPVYVRLGLGTETPELARFMGPKGILDAGEYDLKYFPQAGVDIDPSYYASSFPSRMREEYVKQWHAEHAPPLGKEPIHEEVAYHGHDWDDMRPHLNTFFQAVKSRKAVAEDAVFGNHAAIACHMANESYFRRKSLYWDEASRALKT